MFIVNINRNVHLQENPSLPAPLKKNLADNLLRKKENLACPYSKTLVIINCRLYFISLLIVVAFDSSNGYLWRCSFLLVLLIHSSLYHLLSRLLLFFNIFENPNVALTTFFMSLPSFLTHFLLSLRISQKIQTFISFELGKL